MTREQAIELELEYCQKYKIEHDNTVHAMVYVGTPTETSHLEVE